MSKLRAALEAIDFQKMDFADEINSYISQIFESKTFQEAASHTAIKAIEEIVFKRTNLQIKFIIEDSFYCYSSVPLINGHHIFYDPLFRIIDTQGIDDNIRQMKKISSEAWVDLKEAKVGGFYKSCINRIVIGYRTKKIYKLTNEETTAVFLHELGHAFNNLEYCYRTASTNQVLAAVTRAFDQAGQNPLNDKYKIVLKDVGLATGYGSNYFEELTEVSNKDTLTTLILHKGYKDPVLVSLTNTAGYDYVADENLADLFAARFGYGRHLVTALAKLPENIAESSKMSGYLSIVAESLALVLIPTASIVLATVSPALSVFYTLLLIAGLYGNGETSKIKKYDDIKVRYLRIREQEVTRLKNKDLDPKEVKQGLRSIEIMDKIIDKTRNEFSLFSAISNFIFSKDRKAKKAVDLQRELETLAANNIYAKAAALTLIE